MIREGTVSVLLTSGGGLLLAVAGLPAFSVCDGIVWRLHTVATLRRRLRPPPAKVDAVVAGVAAFAGGLNFVVVGDSSSPSGHSVRVDC